MAARKVFISSVRRGLEEERDSLPALIKAVGHVPRRFEDFTAQPQPSRDACLAGVEDADVYLLLLGPNYGEPIFDSGLSPTEEEWMVAKRRGIPILVLRKLNVDLDHAQLAFAKRVEDYVTGRFRDTFLATADLLSKVAEKLRELDQETGPLVWVPLERAASPDWIITDEQLRYNGVGPTVELHAVPLGVTGRVPATELERVPDRLARVGREHGLFGTGDALELGGSEDRAHAARAASRDLRAAGLALNRGHQVSLWVELPRDLMGAILDRADLANRLGQLIRIAAELLPAGADQVTFAVGLGPTRMISEGDIRDLGRRSSASMGMGDRLIRVDGEDAVPTSVIVRAADEIAAEFASRLILRFRAR